MDKNDFLIPLNGLPSGRKEFEGKADKEFFRSFDNAEILDAGLDVTVVTEKSGQYLGVDCEIRGEVVTVCDRCLEELTLPVDTGFRLSIKYGQEENGAGDDEAGSDREVVYLPEHSADLDLAQAIYDYVCLSMPLQRFHPDGQCNPEVMKHLAGVDTAGEKMDSPFAALKDLFGN